MSDSDTPLSSFTFLALSVADEARKRAERFNQIITPDHVLLGILHYRESVGCQLLLELDVDIEDIQNIVEAYIALSVPAMMQSELYYSQEVRRVLALSSEQTTIDSAQYIDTVALLIGIIEEGTSFSAQELKNRRISAKKLRKQLSSLVSSSEPPPTASEIESFKIVSARPKHPKPKQSQNWDRFLPSARALLAKAQDYAISFHQEKLTPDHLTLGILDMPDSDAYHCLTNLQVNVNLLHQTITERVNSSTKDQPVPKVMLSDELKRVLELSVEEARLASAHYLTTRFLLLGILREDTSFAAKELQQHGVSLQSVRDQRRHVWEENYREVDESSN